MPIDFSKLAQPCDLHELTGCSICSGLDKELAAEDRAADGPMTWDQVATLGNPPPGHAFAQYPGRCAACGAAFRPGDIIRHSKAFGGWVGAVCC